MDDAQFHESLSDLIKDGCVEVVGWTEESGAVVRRTRKFWVRIREMNGGEIPQKYYKAYQMDIDCWEGT